LIYLKEIGIDLVWSLLALIAAAIVTADANYYSDMSSFVAAAFFGYVIVLVYLSDAIYRCLVWKRGEQAANNASMSPS